MVGISREEMVGVRPPNKPACVEPLPARQVVARVRSQRNSRRTAAQSRRAAEKEGKACGADLDLSVGMSMEERVSELERFVGDERAHVDARMLDPCRPRARARLSSRAPWAARRWRGSGARRWPP